MAHENLKQHLVGNAGKSFVSTLTRSVYSWANKVPDVFYNYRIFEELTIRYETDEKTRLGLDKQEHYRFDAVFFIQPGQRALNQHQCYTAGVELKNSKSDLMGDDKIVKYLSWTNYFFIGVPSDLIEDAKAKIKEIYKTYIYAKDLIGLMNVESGKIEILPKRQSVTVANTCKIQEQIIYNVLFNEIKTISFSLNEIEVEKARFNDNPVLDNSVLEQEKTTENVLSESVPSVDSNIENIYSEISSSQLSSSQITSETKTKAGSTKETPVHDAEYRKELAERKAERLNALSQRGECLPASTAAIYNALDPNSKEVFWGIVDSQNSSQSIDGNITGRVTRETLSNATGLSLQKIDRSLVPLTEKGLISREGGKKNGTYIVTVETDKSKTCESCKLYSQCQYVHSNEGCSMFQ